LPVGDYHRPIKGGTYQVTFSKEEYYPQTIEVNVTDDETIVLDVQLVTIGIGFEEYEAGNSVRIYPNPFSSQLSFEVKETMDVGIFSIDGRLIRELQLQSGTTNIDLGSLKAGVYMIKAGNESYRIIKK
jgi:hypothetical protein